jgi:MYXO-CTERM domain-containing protein
VGTSFGQVLSFNSVAPPPVVVTVDATDITSNGATVNGTANANGTDTNGWFRYDTTNPGSCNDNFGTRVPLDNGLPLGSGTGVAPYSVALTGLKSNTTYYFCAVAANKGGASFGQVLTLKTDFAPPTVTTLPASVEPTGVVTLKATANPNGLDATGWFQYDKTNPGQCHENFGTRTRIFPLGNGGDDQQFSETVSTLEAGTYYYCAIAFTTAGTSHGEIQTFDVGGGSGGGAGGCSCATAPQGSVLVLFGIVGFAFFARRRRRS